MTVSPALMSSVCSDWFTPREILDVVEKVGGRIVLDPCSHPEAPISERAMVRLYRDGLEARWSEIALGGLVYVNPPYGRAIGPWVAKCADEGERVPVVGLLPARTDTEWWHSHIACRASAVAFLQGRVRFMRAGAGGVVADPAPFPSALVFWCADDEARAQLVARFFDVVDAGLEAWIVVMGGQR